MAKKSDVMRLKMQMDFDVFVRSLKNGKKMLIWDVLISHNTEA
jgi:hypothetical protein